MTENFVTGLMSKITNIIKRKDTIRSAIIGLIPAIFISIVLSMSALEYLKNQLIQMFAMIDIVCVIIGLSAFLVIWETYESNSCKNRFIGYGFLAAAGINLIHVFYFQSTLLTDTYSYSFSITFSVLRRLAEALLLFTLSINNSFKCELGKYKSLLFPVLTVALFWVTLMVQPIYTEMAGEGAGLFVSILMEIFIIILMILALILIRRKKDTHWDFNHNVLKAIVLGILGNILVTFSQTEHELPYQLFGHIIRLFCYSYLLKGLFTDIIQYPYKKLEDEIAVSERRFVNVYENSPLGMAYISLDGEWADVNNSLCSILGYKKEELLNMRYVDVIFEGQSDSFQETMDILFREEKNSIRLRRKYLSKQGQIIWININKSVIKGKDGVPIYIFAQFEDVTERNNARELRKQAAIKEKEIREAKVLEGLRVEFFANISHEFRTPLNVIFNGIQLLEYNINISDNGELKKLKTTVKSIKQNGYRLLRLINNLIDITEIDAGYFEMNFKNMDIVKTVEDAAMSAAQYAKGKNINLIFDTEVEEKIVSFDPEKIERTILNIISNSIKFTERGGMIEVNIYDRGETVEISIKDNGIGIPEEKIGIVFERFRQVDRSTTRSNEGSGIGLSLVKSLIEMHNGEISIRSKEGEGTEIVISLPAKLTADADTYTDYEKEDGLNGNHVEKLETEFSDIYF